MEQFNIWQIGVSAASIIDNLGDFYIGQVRTFDVRMRSDEYTTSNEHVKKAEFLGVASYRVTGELIYLKNNYILLDFGFRALGYHKQIANIRQGQYVNSDIKLSVKTDIDKTLRAEIPDLIYTWRIEQILERKIPLIEKEQPNKKKIMLYSYENTELKEIDRTNALHDTMENKGYFINYTIACKLMK